jgi:hypothetical protein
MFFGCAVPVEEIESAATTTATHDSTWFHIEYQPWGQPEAPPKNCSPVIEIKGCYTSITGVHVENVPDYIVDLGRFLDAAHDGLQLHYNMPTSGRMDVKVRASKNNGFVFADGLIEIRNSVAYEAPWSFGQMLRDVAWHEVFHVAQHRAFDGTPHPWAHFEAARRHRWILESTATEEALAEYPVQGPHYFADAKFLLDFPLVIRNGEAPDLRQYAAFIFFRYLKWRNIDLARRFFGEPSPQLTVANAPATEPIEQFFFDQLRAVMPSTDARRDLFRDFALAYQFTRDNAVIPGVRRLLAVAPRSYELTGYERKDPGVEDEPPLAVPNTLGNDVAAVLRAGTMATHAIGLSRVLCDEPGPSCNPEAIPAPDVAKLVVNIRLRAVGVGDDIPLTDGVAHYGAVWRVRPSTPPLRLATFEGTEPERELVYNLGDFKRSDKIVVTVVYDPEVAPTPTDGLLEVTAAFDNACRSKTIVVDYTQSMVGYYGGPGYPLSTEKGCTTLLAKLWGGGGALVSHAFGGSITHGDGGGGAFVAARIPIDPEGELLHVTVPFSSLTGTSAAFPAFIYQPATQSLPPSVIAIAGAGGQAGMGIGWNAVLPPHAGAAHEDAPPAVWTLNGNTVVLAGGTAAGAGGGGIGGTNNTPYGNGKAFTTAMITGFTWEAGGIGPCEAGYGGSGWFGGGGGGYQHCGETKLGAGGGGGASYAISSRLGEPVVSTLVGGARRTPGNVDDPDRMTPPPPTNACQEGGPNPGDPGRGRSGAGPAWCDNPGRAVIKFGKAAANDASLAP